MVEIPLSALVVALAPGRWVVSGLEHFITADAATFDDAIPAWLAAVERSVKAGKLARLPPADRMLWDLFASIDTAPPAVPYKVEHPAGVVAVLVRIKNAHCKCCGESLLTAH